MFDMFFLRKLCIYIFFCKLTLADLHWREAGLRIDGGCTIVDHQFAGILVGIAEVAPVDAALVRSLDELQTAVLQGAVLEGYPKAHRRVGVRVQEPRVLVRSYLAAHTGILVDVHALADGRAIVIQLPADLTNPVTKSNCIEGGMLYVQGVTHFVQGNHGIH